jgi:hypothetical protein
VSHRDHDSHAHPEPRKPTRAYAFLTSPAGLSILLLIGSSVLFVPPLVLLVSKRGTSPVMMGLVGATALVVAFIAALPHLFDINRVYRMMKVAGSLLFVGVFIIGASLTPYARKEVAVLVPLFAVLAIAFFSFLPAWLYFQFVFRRSRTIWAEYVLNLYRLKLDHPAALPEPPRSSGYWGAWYRARRAARLSTDGAPTHNLYRHKFEAQFGISRGTDSGVPAVRGESLFPVAIATMLICAGWVLVVLNEMGLTDFVTQAGSEHPFPVETIAFGFLGAYAYTLQMLVRRFFQNDLKSGAYITATMRIVVVTLLVWVIHLVPPVTASEHSQEIISAFAFVVGVFPDVGWQAIQAIIKAPMKVLVPSLRQAYPLSDLDGLNPFYESRLLEEGIEDMQNLATASLVDVMLNTRIPVERMVDWVDQALLYLHLPVVASGDGPTPRDRLRAFGIRTATDLADGFDSKDKQFVARLERLLNANENEPSATRSILSTLRREPNLYHIEEWKTHSVPHWVLEEEDDVVQAPAAVTVIQLPG